MLSKRTAATIVGQILVPPVSSPDWLVVLLGLWQEHMESFTYVTFTDRVVLNCTQAIVEQLSCVDLRGVHSTMPGHRPAL